MTIEEMRRSSRGSGFKITFVSKSGYGVRDTNDFVVSRISGDVVAITPGTQLKPGDYLLSFARLELRYDFGIPTEKK